MLLALLSVLVRGLLVSLSGWAVLFLMDRAGPRRYSAAMRHSICAGVCVGVICIPLFYTAIAHPSNTLVKINVPSPRIVQPLPPVTSAPVAEVAASLPQKPAVTAADPISTVAPRSEEPTRPTLPPAGDLILIAYAVGASFFLLRALIGQVLAWRLVFRATPIPADQMLVATPYRVCESSEVRVPMTLGLGRWAIVVLPQEAYRQWNADRLRAALLHEAAHIRRHDYACQIVADVALAIHFVNPLLYGIVRRMREEAERAADDAVLTTGEIGATDYASQLLRIAAELRRPVRASAPVTMACRVEVGARIAAILAPGTNRTPMTRKTNPRITWLFGVMSLAWCGPYFGLVAAAPSVASTVLPTTRSSTAYKQTLSDGTTVEVVSIAPYPSWDKPHSGWWRPDGAPGKGPLPYESLVTDKQARARLRPFFQKDKDQSPFEIGLKITGPRARSFHYAQGLGSLSKKTKVIFFAMNAEFDRRTQTDDNVSCFLGRFASEQPSGTIRVGIIENDWHPIFEVSAPGLAGEGVTYSSYVNLTPITIKNIRSTPEGAMVTISHQPFYRGDELVDVEFQATLKNRKVFGYCKEATANASTVVEQMLFRGVPVASIQNIQVVAREFDWLNISNIALRPLAAATVNTVSVDNSASRWTQVSPTGTRISLLGVGKVYPDKQHRPTEYWTPDGKNLPACPNGDWGTATFDQFLTPTGKQLPNNAGYPIRQFVFATVGKPASYESLDTRLQYNGPHNGDVSLRIVEGDWHPQGALPLQKIPKGEKCLSFDKSGIGMSSGTTLGCRLPDFPPTEEIRVYPVQSPGKSGGPMMIETTAGFVHYAVVSPDPSGKVGQLQWDSRPISILRYSDVALRR